MLTGDPGGVTLRSGGAAVSVNWDHAYGEPTQVGSGFGDGLYGASDVSGRGAGFGVQVGFANGTGADFGSSSRDIVTDPLIVEALRA